MEYSVHIMGEPDRVVKMVEADNVHVSDGCIVFTRNGGWESAPKQVIALFPLTQVTCVIARHLRSVAATVADASPEEPVRVTSPRSYQKSAELLSSFTQYCRTHPEERFWQALRNWSGAHYVLASDALCGLCGSCDTFNSEKQSGR